MAVQCLALAARFAKACRQDNSIANARLTALPDNPGCARRRGCDDCQIDLLIDVGDGGIAKPVTDFVVFGIDRKDRPVKSPFQQVHIDPGANRTTGITGAKNRQGTRIEEIFQATGAHAIHPDVLKTGFGLFHRRSDGLVS